MIRTKSHKTQKTGYAGTKRNMCEYKFMLLNDLRIAVLRGDKDAEARMESILNTCAKSGSKIADTVLCFSRQKGSIRITGNQLMGLAARAAKINLYIPVCPSPVVEVWKPVHAAQPEPAKKSAAAIHKDTTPVWTPDPNGVRLSDKVEIVNAHTGECHCMEIVGSGEGCLAESRVSVDTPVAAALLGHVAGDTICVNTPSMVMSYNILKINR